MEKEYQMLNTYVLNDNFGDFTRCTENWLTIDESRAQRLFQASLETAEMLRHAVPDNVRSWENVKETMAAGKAVRVYDTIFRELRDQPCCPLCGGYIDGEGALSRMDNRTVICSDCGLKESLDDLMGVIMG